MMYLKATLYAPVSFAFKLFVWLTCWLWAAIAATLKARTLWGPLGWVHTHDDDIYGSEFTLEPVPDTWARRFNRAIWWLCRNPGYGLNAHVLGLRGPLPVVCSAANKEDGIWCSLGPKGFSYRRDWSYSANHYIKIEWGWTTSDHGTGYHKYDFSVAPKRRK